LRSAWDGTDMMHLLDHEMSPIVSEEPNNCDLFQWEY